MLKSYDILVQATGIMLVVFGILYFVWLSMRRQIDPDFRFIGSEFTFMKALFKNDYPDDKGYSIVLYLVRAAYILFLMLCIALLVIYK